MKFDEGFDKGFDGESQRNSARGGFDKVDGIVRTV